MIVDDVTDEVRARPDAHPLKPYDAIMRVRHPSGATYHVKLRTQPLLDHAGVPMGSEVQPVLAITAALADETGKALIGANGKPAVHRHHHEFHFLGHDPGVDDKTGEPLPEHDVEAAFAASHAGFARVVARTADAFAKLRGKAGGPGFKPSAPINTAPAVPAPISVLALPAPETIQ